ncbi:hypothetical protein NXS19_000481 [Fusarium pseudograminearum]|nr:hypothetical protein NXS19_000481 [Fusarium pseudograminearum]
MAIVNIVHCHIFVCLSYIGSGVSESVHSWPRKDSKTEFATFLTISRNWTELPKCPESRYSSAKTVALGPEGSAFAGCAHCLMGIGSRRLLGILGLWVVGSSGHGPLQNSYEHAPALTAMVLSFLPYDGRLAMSISPSLQRPQKGEHQRYCTVPVLLAGMLSFLFVHLSPFPVFLLAIYPHRLIPLLDARPNGLRISSQTPSSLVTTPSPSFSAEP